MHGKSLQAQREYLLQYASDHQMSIVGIYADEGKTARKELRKRKAVHALIEAVKQAKIDVILFWKMDRWFRNVSDFYKVQDVLDAHQVKWIAAAEPNINMDTRDGRLNLNIMLSIGQNEVDTTSERIRFVNENSIRQGRVIFGNAAMPFGYRVETSDGVKRMAKDPAKAAITEDAFQYYLRHHTKIGTVKYINQKYGNIFSLNIMNKLCKNPMYYGCYRDNTNYCPPYLSKAEYEQLQQLNGRNVTVRFAAPDQSLYLFTGLLKCPLCGRTLSSNTRRKKAAAGIRYYRYYRCLNHYTNHQCPFSRSCGEAALEQYLLRRLSGHLQKYRIRIIAVREQLPQKKIINKEKLVDEIERLNFIFQKGRISESRYNDEYALLTAQLEAPESSPPRTERKAVGALSNGWEAAYQTLSRERKRCFWRGLISSIEQSDDGLFHKILFR